VEPAQVEIETRVPEDPASGRKVRSLTRAIANSFCVLAVSLTGLILGAFAAYFCAAVYLISFAPKLDPSAACARGNAIAFLSIFVGGFLGTMCGSVFAAKHLVENESNNVSLRA
jgi:hypothetical protein